MSDEKPKIVYLFGAGATHAEKLLYCRINGIKINDDAEDKNGKNIGLLAKQVSKRIVNQLLKEKINSRILLDRGINNESLYNRGELGSEPYFDIELLISLLEAEKIEKSAKHARILRRLFRQDILDNLKKITEPRLYSALIELQEQNTEREELIGFLTLNYDSMVEQSFKSLKKNFDYGFKIDCSDRFPHKPEKGNCSLLKLHGSFNWYIDSRKNKIITSESKGSEEMQWIPPGLNKEYLNYPYNIIHGKAFELLKQCTILRIVGCSLSLNDLGLLSLLFRTQKSRQQNAYTIEIIDNPKKPRDFFTRLGMFLNFKQSFYESFSEFTPTGNSFLDWLYYKVNETSKCDISNTKYLKQVKSWVKKYEKK